MEKKSRKTRSDKKIEIRPYISTTHRLWVHRLSRYLELPEGTTGVQLVMTALNRKECIEFFQPYFKRAYLYNQTLYRPSKSQNLDEYLNFKGERDRFKMKFRQEEARKLEEFQFALGTPYLAHATHALLKYALYQNDVIQEVAPNVNPKMIRANPQLSVTKSKYAKALSILK